MKSLDQIQYVRCHIHQYHKKHHISKFCKLEIGPFTTYLMPSRGASSKTIDYSENCTLIQYLNPVTRMQNSIISITILSPNMYHFFDSSIMPLKSFKIQQSRWKTNSRCVFNIITFAVNSFFYCTIYHLFPFFVSS